MISGKTLFAYSITELAVIGAANAADASTQTLTLVGVIGALGAALIGVYSAFRTAKHTADVRDGDLIKGKLNEALNRIAFLERQVDIWQTLYQAREGSASGSKDHPTIPPRPENTP
jgi:hypothetical protein